MSEPRTANRTALAVGGTVAGLGVVAAAVFGTLYETGTAPFGDSPSSSDDAEITAATQTWVEAMNSQKIDRMKASMCAGDQQKFAGQQDQPPVADPVRVDSVTDVAVHGSTATATMTASVGQGDQTQTQTFPLGFAMEDGVWKVCQSAGTAASPGRQSAGGGQAPAGLPD